MSIPIPRRLLEEELVPPFATPLWLEEEATATAAAAANAARMAAARAERASTNRMAVNFVELDEEADGAAMRCRLGIRTGRTSVPSVWVAGEYIGGLNDGPGLLPLDEQGELEPKLRAAGAL